jgi:ubiquinone/menaquinone biosynthesis C-methylase UbiE
MSVPDSSSGTMSQYMWASGDLYEPYVGRWSRLVAVEFLRWIEPDEALAWLDVGCGTGALSEAILRRAAPMSVHGLDPSPGFVDHARARIADPRFSAEVGDAKSLRFPGERFDAAVAGLVLNFVPDAPARSPR